MATYIDYRLNNVANFGPRDYSGFDWLFYVFQPNPADDTNLYSVNHLPEDYMTAMRSVDYTDGAIIPTINTQSIIDGMSGYSQWLSYIKSDLSGNTFFVLWCRIVDGILEPAYSAHQGLGSTVYLRFLSTVSAPTVLNSRLYAHPINSGCSTVIKALLSPIEP